MKTYTLLDLIKLALANWWKVLITGLIGMLIFAGISKITDRQVYTASNTLISTHPTPTQVPNGQGTDWVISDQFQQDILSQKTIRTLIKNAAITQTVAEKMNNQFNLSGVNKYTAGKVSSAISTSSPVNTVLVKISATDKSADKAAELVNYTVETAKEKLPSMLSSLGVITTAKENVNAKEAVKISTVSLKKNAVIGFVFAAGITILALIYMDIRRVLK